MVGIPVCPQKPPSLNHCCPIRRILMTSEAAWWRACQRLAIGTMRDTTSSLPKRRQKAPHDKRTWKLKLKVGDRVMVFMPHQTTGRSRKLVLPYYGPQRVLDVTSAGVSVRPVDRPDEEPILVNMDRVTKCPDELPNESWTGRKRR